MLRLASLTTAAFLVALALGAAPPPTAPVTPSVNSIPVADGGITATRPQVPGQALAPSRTELSKHTPPNIEGQPVDQHGPTPAHPEGMDLPAWIEAIAAAVTGVFTVILAIATIRLWSSTRGLHTETKRLAAQAEAQSKDMKASIEVAQRAAEAAEKTLIAGDRPWIEIKAEVSGPLVFNADKINASVTFTVKNVGRSPATNVTLYAQLHADVFEARRHCEEVVRTHSNAMHSLMGLGTIHFPNDPVTSTRELEMPKADFVARIAEMNSLDVQVEGEPATENEPCTHAWPGVSAIAFYVLPNDPKKRSRYTTIVLEFQPRAGGSLGSDGSPGVFGARDVMLVQTYHSGQAT